MKLVISEEAARRLASMQPKLAKDILRRLEAIAENPFANHPNVERLKGHKDWWRLRKGDWRVLYFVDRRNEQLRAEAVEHRSTAYRN
jgi:mRNA-degrading endonuclease RelE of RelBE toxin-antitoxin system